MFPTLEIAFNILDPLKDMSLPP